MKAGSPRSFGGQLKSLREAAHFTQEELATIAGLSVHAVSALERGERRRPHVETVRALSAALDLTGATRDAFLESARSPTQATAVDELTGVSLPVPLTELLGRETDVHTLRQWLADPAARLITLIGPGGVGKTRLALELARAIADESATRVVFVPLAAIRDPAFVESAIAEAFGLVDVASRDLPRRVRVACEHHSTLLVLDNFEQVLDAAGPIADLLTSVPLLRLLVTSRAPLRVRGEREYIVGPLAFDTDANVISPADLAREPAVRLFVERVRDVQPDFRLTSANGPTVAAICKRLDALPLALELAAPWIKVLTADDLLHRLGHDLLLSTVGSRDLPQRQQTMNATVAWSYQLLSPAEQCAFRRFAALPGRFSIEAAAAVLGGRASTSPRNDHVLATVANLIDKSLLLRAETSVATRPVFEMLETVRAYAALELTASGERDDALNALASYCSGEASVAAEGLVGPAQAEWLDRVRDDLENYRGAMRWLISRGRSAEASDVAWGLKYFWIIRGYGAEGLQWFQEILGLPDLSPAAESRALEGAAVLWYTQGELGRARTALARVLDLSRDDVETVVRAQDLTARVEHALGNLSAARERFTLAVEGFRSLAIQWGRGNALSGMASAALATGDVGQAERLLDEAMPVLRQAGPWFRTWALYVRAIVAVQRGNADEAIGRVRESLTYIRDLQDKYAFAYTLVPLVAAAIIKTDDAWAARILGALDEVTERTGATVVLKLVHDLHTRSEREVRARLGPDRWAAAYAAGRQTSFDALLEDIDRVLR
ncbi:MAG TPA: helix-turn-helix domain-containing protein [Vicinamibacterales bacterium]|nr:helix-turn-helix domain-containing protein [Vicinamibacterales bacterium]